MKGGDLGKSTMKIRKEMNKLSLKLSKCKSKGEKIELYMEFKQMKKELKEIEFAHIVRVFQAADVVCCTLTSASDKTLRHFIHNKLNDRLFDVCVIDECAQSVEPACWIAVQFCKKLILAGDHKQLEATVKSKEASKKGLSLSLFERVMNFENKECQTMLVE